MNLGLAKVLVRAAPCHHCHQFRGTSFGPLRRATTTPVPPNPSSDSASWSPAWTLSGSCQVALAERSDSPTCASRSGQQQKQREQQQWRRVRVARRRGPGSVHGLSVRVTSRERGVASPGLLCNSETRAMEPRVCCAQPAPPAGSPREGGCLGFSSESTQASGGDGEADEL
jgi:hypothetical protein